jgi:phosphotransferase system enzyme I (PtsP)
MAHEERYLPFFLGIGVRALSVDPAYLPRLQRAIGRLTRKGAEVLAQQLLAESRATVIEGLLEAHLQDHG